MQVIGRTLRSTLEWIAGPPPRAVAATLGLLLLVGYADLRAGAAFNLAPLYVLPVLIATWSGLRGFGIAAALLAALSWSLFAPFASELRQHLVVNGALRFLSLATISLLLTALKSLLSQQAELARSDPLTRLLNRRGFLQALEGELARLTRGGGPLSIAYADVDGLKSVNDRLGHAAGDRVLLALAQSALDCLRRSDTAARIGGDELAFLLPGAGRDEAVPVLERLAASFAVRCREHGWPVGLSIGAVVAAHPACSAEWLLGAADRAMYAAKARGGRVVELVELPPQRPAAEPGELGRGTSVAPR